MILKTVHVYFYSRNKLPVTLCFCEKQSQYYRSYSLFISYTLIIKTIKIKKNTC